jgi:hypothetical protein
MDDEDRKGYAGCERTVRCMDCTMMACEWHPSSDDGGTGNDDDLG